jgi:hypothetical protein
VFDGVKLTDVFNRCIPAMLAAPSSLENHSLGSRLFARPSRRKGVKGVRMFIPDDGIDQFE